MRLHWKYFYFLSTGFFFKCKEMEILGYSHNELSGERENYTTEKHT